MKKSLLTLFVLAALFFTSCKKETANTVDTTITTPAEYTLTAQNLANIEGVKNLPNQDVKKIAFRLLAPIEKYGAWIENIKIVSANFTPQQKALTVELVAFLTPQIFDGSAKGPSALFRDAWLGKAEKVFTKAQIAALAYQLFSTTDAKSGLQINQADTQLPKCECNTDSQYDCGGTSACHRSDDMQPCKDPTSWGCGFCWGWPCDNTCIVIHYPSE